MGQQQGEHIGRFQVERVLGQGGVGIVYLGIDPAIRRRVAIKVLTTGGGEAYSRFLTEIRATGNLAHPNIASVYDVGTTPDERVFVVQEFVDGVDLSQLIARHPSGLPTPVATHLLMQLASALAYAHEQGVVHRDVKPSNLRVTASGTVKLLDFGIARVVHRPSETTTPGTVVGTPQYMAPEQIRGDDPSPSVDVFSFGTVAYELLTGRRPFAADNFAGLVMQVMQQAPPPLRSINRSVSDALADVIEQCLAKLPSDRPASMGMVAERLRSLTQGWDPDIVQAAEFETTPPAPIPDPGPPFLASAKGDAAAASEAARLAVGWDPLAPLDARALASTNTFAKVPAPGAISMPAPLRLDARDLRGQTIGRFVLHERLARGKTGDLYKAYDPVRGELVGVKVVFDGDRDAVERLLRGGRIWIKLNHPNIVRVFEVHPDYGGVPGVIVTELVDGINLDELIAQRSLALEETVWIVLQVCEALAQIHARSVVHREVKPRNILVSGDDLHVTLLDSGIARHANPEVDAFTKTGVFVGDLAYAAPELALGRADQRADIYAVVAVLYELVTRSKLPFPLASGWQPPAQALEALPLRLRAAIERGLRADPAARFAGVAELRDQLRPLAAGRHTDSTTQAVVALHGIRTQAAWQRTFSEVAGRHGLSAHIDRWNFGYFSVLRFVAPWARLAKVRWFRETYQREFKEGASSGRPSIVAHSFGTYILGNALLRYPYLRFDKVLLCGSILPTSFPWERVIERGQVQAVRNEFGTHDIWTQAVRHFVPGTGPSGLVGFNAQHPRLQQERFAFEHSEYFERSHMSDRWLPFLTAAIEQRPEREIEIDMPHTGTPWGLYSVYLLIALGIAAGWTTLR